MTARRPWTDEELGFIQNPPRGWSARRVGEFLGRSRDSVLVKQGQLRRGWVRKNEIISDELIEYVRANSHRKAQDLADELLVKPRTIRRARETIRRAVGERSTATKGTSEHSPHFRGSRTLLARTCLGCGLLWSAGDFRTRGGTCLNCKPRTEPPRQQDTRAYVEAMERVVEQMSTSRIPYRSRHGEPWTMRDLRILDRPDLPVVVKAAKLGRTFKATNTACTRFGIKSHLRGRDRGQWQIAFAQRGAA